VEFEAKVMVEGEADSGEPWEIEERSRNCSSFPDMSVCEHPGLARCASKVWAVGIRSVSE